ncbi:MAG: helix-turn-helix transcriptional regulator [Fibrobacteres bacterium]|nr:helix-turn-helix transcriptional regulator [Fibrobacterota bacterium]
MIGRTKRTSTVRLYDEVKIPIIQINITRVDRATLSDWNFSICDPFYRIYMMDKPGWSIQFNGIKTEMRPGMLYFIPPNTPFIAKSEKTATQFYIMFTLNCYPFLHKHGIYSIKPSIDEMSLIASIINFSAPSSQFACAVNTQRIVTKCLSALPESAVEVKSYSSRVVRAMELMRKNGANVLSNSHLALETGMSTNAFVRLFQEETATSPQKWYLKERMEAAAVKLLNSSDSLDSIAEEFGSCDRFHFTKQFIKHKGISPAAYRKKAHWRD